MNIRNNRVATRLVLKERGGRYELKVYTDVLAAGAVQLVPEPFTQFQVNAMPIRDVIGNQMCGRENRADAMRYREFCN